MFISMQILVIFRAPWNKQGRWMLSGTGVSGFKRTDFLSILTSSDYRRPHDKVIEEVNSYLLAGSISSQHRISPEENSVVVTSIFVQIRPDQYTRLMTKLEEMRREKQHLFPGTIGRYIIEKQRYPEHVEILLLWRNI